MVWISSAGHSARPRMIVTGCIYRDALLSSVQGERGQFRRCCKDGKGKQECCVISECASNYIWTGYRRVARTLSRGTPPAIILEKGLTIFDVECVINNKNARPEYGVQEAQFWNDTNFSNGVRGKCF